MPRLRNSLSGAVMTVSESTATRLGGEWVDADAEHLSHTPDDTWKVADLKAYADENGIELGDASKKDDILAALAADTTVNPTE